MQVPTFQVPKSQVPKFQVPSFKAPRLQLQQLQLQKLQLQGLQLQQLQLQQLQLQELLLQQLKPGPLNQRELQPAGSDSSNPDPPRTISAITEKPSTHGRISVIAAREPHLVERCNRPRTVEFP